VKRFQSQPLDLPVERGRIARADLVFYGVDHSGPTYEARIFLDNPGATEKTPRDVKKGYAGSFTVFGHGGCFGAEDHCAPKDRYVDEFDRRPPHPLTPLTIAVTVTEALAQVKKRKARVNVVAVVRESKMGKAPGASGIPPCEQVRLVTYS
jgi:hypothetical protein